MLVSTPLPIFDSTVLQKRSSLIQKHAGRKRAGRQQASNRDGRNLGSGWSRGRTFPYVSIHVCMNLSHFLWLMYSFRSSFAVYTTHLDCLPGELSLYNVSQPSVFQNAQMVGSDENMLILPAALGAITYPMKRIRPTYQWSTTARVCPHDCQSLQVACNNDGIEPWINPV